MRIFLVVTFLLSLIPAVFVSAETGFLPAKPTVLKRDLCRIYGSVYFEYDPRKRSGTHYTIYEEAEEAFANLVVYKEDNKLFADAPGLWHQASNRDFADFVVFVSPNRNLADFGVYFTKTRSFAGCKD